MVEDLPEDGEDDGVERLDYTPSHEQASSYDFAPNGDADYFQEEDEDGRFFGGGLTGEQKEIMDILEQGDEREDAEPEALNVAGVRKQLLGLERAINKNREMRTRFADEPAKCAPQGRRAKRAELMNSLQIRRLGVPPHRSASAVGAPHPGPGAILPGARAPISRAELDGSAVARECVRFDLSLVARDLTPTVSATSAFR